MSNFEVIRKTNSGNYLVTLVIGKSYELNWRKNFLVSWEKYAHKNDLGILAITDNLISQNDEKWKKPNWQKLLIPIKLLENFKNINNICYLDSDVLINVNSPNIFSFIIADKIGSVSLRNGLPFSYTEMIHRLEHIRKFFLDSRFPLNSALTMDLENLYRYHNLMPQNDELSGGIMLYNLKEFAEKMQKWFFKYSPDIHTITSNGEQTHLSFEILNGNYLNLLEYRFQAIWAHELAWNHFDFFMEKHPDVSLLLKRVAQTLTNVFFLHFAGSGLETKKVMQLPLNSVINIQKKYADLNKFYGKALEGRPLGFYEN